MDRSTATLNVLRTEVEPCHIRLDIEVPVERTDEIRERVIGEFSRAARVPGFRKGKVPKKLLLKRYRNEIAQEIKGHLFEDVVQEAFEQESIEPETTPQIENEDSVTYAEGQPFVFAVSCDVAPEFDLPDYKGIKASKDTSGVEESSVEEVIDGWLQQRTSYSKVDRASEQGDLLKVTYRADLPDGMETPPETSRFLMEAQETWMPLREPALLPGSTTALVGLEADEEKDVTITFPEDFAEDALAGQSLAYHFKIHEVHAAEVPELTDALAQEVGAGSAEEVRERIRNNLAAEKQRSQDRAVRDQIVQTLLAGMDFPLPPSLLRSQTYETLNRIFQSEIRNGASEEDIRSRQKELTARAGELAAQQLRQYYVLRRVAEAEDIDVEAAELAAAVEGLSEAHRATPKVMARRLRESGRLSSVAIGLREEKTIDRLLSLADVAEAGTDKES